jgi:hypothetical protein
MDPWHNVNRKSQDAGGKTTLQDIHVMKLGIGLRPSFSDGRALCRSMRM